MRDSVVSAGVNKGLVGMPRGSPPDVPKNPRRAEHLRQVGLCSAPITSCSWGKQGGWRRSVEPIPQPELAPIPADPKPIAIELQPVGAALILVETKAKARWSNDFVHNQFACGRRFRALNVVDEMTLERLVAMPNTSTPVIASHENWPRSSSGRRGISAWSFRPRHGGHLEYDPRAAAQTAPWAQPFPRSKGETLRPQRGSWAMATGRHLLRKVGVDIAGHQNSGVSGF